LTTLPLVVRRTRTVAAVGLFASALLLQALLGSDLPGGLTETAVLVLMVYAVGAHTASPTTYVLLVAMLLVLAVVIAVGPDPHPANFVYMALVVAASWVAGAVVRMTEERSSLLAERRALQERARIAGELHDVVSHNVSAMVIQAAAERRDQAAGSTAAQTLADIERHGRQTLIELRRLLGVLRIDDRAPLAPQPGIRDLDRLVETSTGSDLRVELHVQGDPQPVAGGASLAVYRVVQESITNARKHSHAKRVAVTLRWSPEVLEVEVSDPGPPRRAHQLPGSGVGLRVMADRLDAVGGTLEAGRTSRGFSTRAVVPLAEGPA
jgi:signal transduction histidine kinase